MLRDRLKEMEMRITELADYLQVSRPTMYKLIECYDSAKFDCIGKDALALFNYITENELVGKKNVINYILSNIARVSGPSAEHESSTVYAVKNYLENNPDSKKSRFISECFLNDEFNDVICYIADIAPLFKKKRLSQSDKDKLAPYKNFIEEIKRSEEK